MICLSPFNIIGPLLKAQGRDIIELWGWSDDEVICAFKRCPKSMMTSDKKVDAFMYYSVNTLKLDPSYSYLLREGLSWLRSISRRGLFLVLGVQDFSLTYALSITENNFFKKFVRKEAPGVM